MAQGALPEALLPCLRWEVACRVTCERVALEGLLRFPEAAAAYAQGLAIAPADTALQEVSHEFRFIACSVLLVFVGCWAREEGGAGARGEAALWRQWSSRPITTERTQGRHRGEHARVPFLQSFSHSAACCRCYLGGNNTCIRWSTARSCGTTEITGMYTRL